MIKQKFHRGNLVRIADDLGLSRSHFKSGCNVIIEGSYADRYGGHDIDSYSVIFPEDGNSCAWYHEDQLTLIDTGGESLIEQAKENKLKLNVHKVLLRNDLSNLGHSEILDCLFLIGYYCPDELCMIFDAWREWNSKFDHIRKSKSLEEARSIFSEDELQTLDIEAVWDAVNMKVGNER